MIDPDLVAGLGVNGGAVLHLAVCQREAGVVPGTADSAPLHVAFRERPTQVRAGLLERLDYFILAHEHDPDALHLDKARRVFL